MFQDPNEALIREPGNRIYNAPEPVAVTAKSLWEYAVLSENVYSDRRAKKPSDLPAKNGLRSKPQEPSPEAYSDACTPDSQAPIPLPGWTRWTNVPSPDLLKEADDVGLVVEIWEKSSAPPIIAAVFRGTEWSLRDWITNIRWFIPFHRDQYTLVAEKVGNELLQEVKKRLETDRERYSAVTLVATGHSLGGGLAQHLAYSLPSDRMPDGMLTPRVNPVHVFDPSPVTGWFSVDRNVRETNAKGLRIDRAFEHGEILAYLRLIMSYINPPTANDPSIREIRYNFVDSINPFSSHSMRLLACELVQASGTANIPDLRRRFQK